MSGHIPNDSFPAVSTFGGLFSYLHAFGVGFSAVILNHLADAARVIAISSHCFTIRW
jgi:hypothetical protein